MLRQHQGHFRSHFRLCSKRRIMLQHPQRTARTQIVTLPRAAVRCVLPVGPSIGGGQAAAPSITRPLPGRPHRQCRSTWLNTLRTVILQPHAPRKPPILCHRRCCSSCGARGSAARPPHRGENRWRPCSSGRQRRLQPLFHRSYQGSIIKQTRISICFNMFCFI